MCFGLEAGVYDLSYSDIKGYYLSKRRPFQLPSKLYVNDYSSYLEVIKTDYLQSDKSVGVLLYGMKGTGKTMDAKRLVTELNKPCIVINSVSMVSNNMSRFLQFINSPELNDTVIFLDEFEKGLGEDEDVALLSWFDGTGLNKHLYLMVVNDHHLLNDLFFNRLSRIKYSVQYGPLKKEVIEEIVSDIYKGTNEELEKINHFLHQMFYKTFDNIVSVVSTAERLRSQFSFDQIKDLFNLVEESRYYRIRSYTGSLDELETDCLGVDYCDIKMETKGESLVTNENQVVLREGMSTLVVSTKQLKVVKAVGDYLLVSAKALVNYYEEDLDKDDAETSLARKEAGLLPNSRKLARSSVEEVYLHLEVVV